MQILFASRKVAELVPSDMGPALICDPEWLRLKFATFRAAPLICWQRCLS